MKGKKIVIVLASALVVAGVALSSFAAATVLSDKPVQEQAASAPDALGTKYAPMVHAQAFVDDGGTYTRKRAFLAITHPAAGKYCLLLPSSIPPAKYVANVSPEYTNSLQTDISAQWVSGSADCPSTQWAEVRTFSSGTTASDEAFSITIP